MLINIHTLKQVSSAIGYSYRNQVKCHLVSEKNTYDEMSAEARKVTINGNRSPLEEKRDENPKHETYFDKPNESLSTMNHPINPFYKDFVIVDGFRVGDMGLLAMNCVVATRVPFVEFAVLLILAKTHVAKNWGGLDLGSFWYCTALVYFLNLKLSQRKRRLTQRTCWAN